MLFHNSLLALFVSATLTAAFPNYPTKPESTCSAVYKTKTKVGETTTKYLSTKTIYVPITSVSNKPTTTVKPYPVTSVGVSSKTVTNYETHTKTKTYPVTTVIYSTKVETKVYTKTKVETKPYTSVYTSYKTDVGSYPVTYVTKTESKSVCTETKKVPFTTTSVETKTVCATKGGYGNGYNDHY